MQQKPYKKHHRESLTCLVAGLDQDALPVSPEQLQHRDVVLGGLLARLNILGNHCGLHHGASLTACVDITHHVCRAQQGGGGGGRGGGGGGVGGEVRRRGKGEGRVRRGPRTPSGPWSRPVLTSHIMSAGHIGGTGMGGGGGEGRGK